MSEKYVGQEALQALVSKMDDFATKDAVQAVSDKLREFAATVRYQLVRTEDTNIDNGQYLAPVITDKGTLVTGCPSSGSNKPLIYSEDNGVTWKNSNVTPGATLGLGIAKDGTVIAVVQGGIYYSVDGGKTWQAASFTVANNTLSAMYGTVKVLTAPNGNIIVHADRTNAQATSILTSVSTNNGRSWSTIQSGTLGCKLMNVVSCKNGHLLGLTTVITPSYPSLGWSGENSSNAAINVSASDNMDYYSNTSPYYGILKDGVHSYALARGDQSRLPLDNLMLRSTDGGVTWQGYATVRGRALYLFADDNGDICVLRGFACQGSYNGSSGTTAYGTWAWVVSRSSDNGASWSDSATCYTKNFVVSGNSGYVPVPWSQSSTMVSVASNIIVIYGNYLTVVARVSDLTIAPFKMTAGTQVNTNVIQTKQAMLASPDGTYIMGPLYSIDGFHWRVVPSIGSIVYNSYSVPDRQFSWQNAALLPNGNLVCVGDAQYGIKLIPSIEPFI